MKKTLLMLLAVMFSVAMMADDMIITKDSQRINGKIEEVGLDAIKYRRSDNPTGPLYTLQKKDIATIIYENGHIETFQEAQQSQQPAVASSNNNQVTAKNTNLVPITYSGGLYHQGDKSMTPKEYLNFVQRHCPAAYNQYKKGDAMATAGGYLTIFGLIAGVELGAFLYCWKESEYIDGYGTIEYKKKSTWASGIALMTVGCVATTAGIPLWCVGAKKRKTSHETYNNECAPEITYNITAGRNGIGLAINF